MRRLALLGLALLLAAIPGAAQQHPNVARGFSSSGSFNAGNLDSINLFNGNLVIRIPLGHGYPVGGKLSYQLGLTYNNNVWDHEQREVDGVVKVSAFPSRTANAGLGWMVSLGRLNPPQGDLDTASTTYMSPDGAMHTFYPTLHDGEAAASGVKYTRDGTYLRYKSAVNEVEFPDGAIHKFNAEGFPVQIRDRFTNRVDVDYSVANLWKITDTTQRVQKVYFRSDLPGGYPMVDRVELAAFGGAAATYSFQYSNATLTSPCGNTDSTTNSVFVPLLTQVTLPDGSAYAMPAADYATETTAPCRVGMLERLTLPTLGRIEWDYILYTFPDNSTPRTFRRFVAGVGKRRLLDAANPGNVIGEWAYSTALTQDPAFRPRRGCSTPSRRAPSPRPA